MENKKPIQEIVYQEEVGKKDTIRGDQLLENEIHKNAVEDNVPENIKTDTVPLNRILENGIHINVIYPPPNMENNIKKPDTVPLNQSQVLENAMTNDFRLNPVPEHIKTDTAPLNQQENGIHSLYFDIASLNQQENGVHNLYFEVNRLLTFKDWPITWLSPFDMARSGFYFTRNKDHAACAFCGGVIGAWEKEDTADGQHKFHFPRCKFMNKESVGNVPISVSQILEKKRSQATIHQHPRVREAPHIKNSAETVVHFNNLHLWETRYSSFYSWCPRNVWPNNGRGLPRPRDLASSGFSYCGLSDHVICYSCGIRLQGWTFDDDVDNIHRAWSPSCRHINGNPSAATNIPIPPPLEEERRNDCVKKKKYIFRDEEIDIMMKELDILKVIGEGTVCKIIDCNSNMKQSMYGYVRASFKKKLEKTGMLYNTFIQGYDDVCIDIEKIWRETS